MRTLLWTFFFFVRSLQADENCRNPAEAALRVMNPKTQEEISTINDKINLRGPSSQGKSTKAFSTSKRIRVKNRAEGPKKSRFPESTNIFNKIYTKDADENSHYEELYQMVRKLSSTNPRACYQELNKYYKTKSIWKDFDRRGRLDKIYQLAQDNYNEIINVSEVHKCHEFTMDYYQEKIKTVLTEFLVFNFEQNKKMMEDTSSVGRHKAIMVIEEFFNFAKKTELLQKLPIDSHLFIPQIDEMEFEIKVPLQLKSPYRYYLKWNRLSEDNTYKNLLQFLALEVSEVLASDFILSYSTWLKKALNQTILDKKYSKEELGLCIPLFDIFDQYTTNNNIEQIKEKKAAVLLGLQEKIQIFNQRLRPENPYQTHPLLGPAIAICIADQETHTTHDPHTLNYTYCQKRHFMRSSAQGLGQTTYSTFKFLINLGALPLVEEKNLTEEDIEYLFEKLNERPDWQIKTILYHFNYLLKVKNDSTISSSVVAYDLDNRSRYLKNVTRCLNCLKNQAKNNNFSSKVCHP